jgi:hypothetical protein
MVGGEGEMVNIFYCILYLTLTYNVIYTVTTHVAVIITSQSEEKNSAQRHAHIMTRHSVRKISLLCFGG